METTEITFVLLYQDNNASSARDFYVKHFGAVAGKTYSKRQDDGGESHVYEMTLAEADFRLEDDDTTHAASRINPKESHIRLNMTEELSVLKTNLIAAGAEVHSFLSGGAIEKLAVVDPFGFKWTLCKMDPSVLV